MRFKFRKNKLAFTLLETVVILGIVGVGLAGVLNLLLNSLRTQNLNRNTLVAYNLAQEGLELIRNVRDTNFLASSSTPWNQSIEGSPEGSSYRVSYQHFTPEPSTFIESQLQMFLDGDNQYFYVYDTSSPINSIFYRLITITADSAESPSSTVSCLVQWQERGRTYQYKLETMLYDWKIRP
jgi:type II secretory pathway pseudopilin PulG